MLAAFLILLGVAFVRAAGPDSAESALGRSWHLVRLTHSEREIELPVADRPDGERYPVGWLDLRIDRRGAGFSGGCNHGGASAHLEGSRLVTPGDVGSTDRGCSGVGPEIDAALWELLDEDPTVEVRGDALTLRSSDVVADFVDRETLERPLPSHVILDRGSRCALGLREGPPVEAGPDPDVAPTGQLGIGGPGRPTWHLVAGDQPVEFHSPVVRHRHLRGQRTEPVQLGRGPATIWYAEGFVQVRVADGFPDNPTCETFEVNVIGPDEQENRDLAVDLADQVVTDYRYQ